MKVFIAHNKDSDGDLADTIAAKLRVMGFDVFFDEDSLPAGQSFDARIEGAIKASDIFVFLISEAALQAKYARTELAIAKRRFRNPSGRVLPVLAEELDITTVDAYLRSVMFQRREGDLATDVALRVKALAKALWIRHVAIVALVLAVLAGGIFGTMAALRRTSGPIEPTALHIASVLRHHEGKPNEGDAFLVKALATNGDSSPVTFEELTAESRRSDLSAAISHEGDRQYWLVVEPGKSTSWPFFVTWSRGGAPMRAGDFNESFDWRVCWVVTKLRSCSDWKKWEPGGTFAPSAVRVLDQKLAARARILESLSAPRDPAERGFWLGLGEPAELGHLSYDGTLAETIALPGEPVQMTRALDQGLAFVATRKPNRILTIDLGLKKIVHSVPIPSEKGRADLPFSIAWDGERLWIIFDEGDGNEALRVVEHDAIRKLPYDEGLQKFGVMLDEMRLYARGGTVFGLTSSSPHYIYRFSSDKVWEVSGHDSAFVGCTSALTATPVRWLAIACGFSLSELVETTWPDDSAVPIDADASLDENIVQKGLDADFAPFDWDAYRLAAAGDTAVVALSRRDRQTYQLLETAVVYRDGAAIWRELFRDDIDVASLAVSGDYALVFARDKSDTQLMMVHLQ